MYDKVHGPRKGTLQRLPSITVLHDTNKMSIRYSAPQQILHLLLNLFHSVAG